MFASLALFVLGALAQAPDPASQFDFWIGEWSVQNRHIQEDNSWREGDVTRARITPVCGGTALLEEWAGPLHGNFMNGFSLRSFDPIQDQWTILLFWTVDGDGAFGRMRGGFRHGRGEFHSSTKGAERTRYSFSDTLPQSVRWDEAYTKDGGRTWFTDWIMEFRRTKPRAETTEDQFFAEAWTSGKASKHGQARNLDWMLGQWSGQQTDAAGVASEARLRCKLINKDCLLVDLLETRTASDQAWNSRLAVRGYESRRQSWATWSVTDEDPILRGARGIPSKLGMSFESYAPTGEPIITERVEKLSDGRLSITRIRQAHATGELEILSTTLLVREPEPETPGK
ncbi:MAG: hypothetical protein P1V35_12015 [Planctomycetota bacterium]|nr:hypothetical protein [Planctomycetota bacterium]